MREKVKRFSFFFRRFLPARKQALYGGGTQPGAAEELLLSTSERVERIAEMCGYANCEHFIRQFGKAAGMTPARFRREALKNE